MTNEYVLYGTGFSYYTGKVRAYLRKKAIPYREVLATRGVYRKFILPRTGVGFIPVVHTPEDQVWQDSTEIIDQLERRYPQHPVLPSGPRQRIVAMLLEIYGDEWLLIPAMHYRWAYQKVNQPYVYQQFGQVLAPGWPRLIRAWLGAFLGKRFKGYVPRLGITEQTIPAIEGSFGELLEALEAHFSAYPYLLGERPSIGDLGLIGPFYAHLYLDPYPGRLLRQRAPAVVRWVERMHGTAPARGEFLSDDEIPETLLPILQRMAREQLPVIRDTDRRLSEWRETEDAGPGARVPRFIGTHPFTLGTVEGERAVVPYVLWMFARAVAAYGELAPEQRQGVDALLARAGFGDALRVGLRNRLARVDNRLVLGT